MSNQVTLSAAVRDGVGKGVARRLRADGRTPAVMYGHDVEPTAVHVDQLELFHALHTEAGLNALIRLEVDGQEHLTLAREVQKHPVRDHIVHVDFLAVSADQRIGVEVPIHLLNEKDVHSTSGGVVNLVLYTLPLKVSPLNVPNYVELDIAGMDIGDVRRAADIALPDDVELDIDPDRTVVTINAPDILEEPEEEVEVTAEELEALEALTEEELAELEEVAAEAELEGEAAEGEPTEGTEEA